MPRKRTIIEYRHLVPFVLEMTDCTASAARANKRRKFEEEFEGESLILEASILG